MLITGYVPLTGFLHFTIKLVVSTFLSSAIAIVLLLVNLQIIRVFDRFYPWQREKWRRILFEILAAAVAGVIFGLFLTLFSHFLFTYEEPLGHVLLINAGITAIVNLLMMTIVEAVIFYKRHQESLLMAEQLERENIGMRFEILKKQLDPHFLFNSLNVLSFLISKDREKAQDFIDEFSAIYRYTLEVIDKPLVTIQEELEFARSYLFLQNIRFGETVSADIQQDCFQDMLVPPLSVQMLLENAFKHNIATKESPLYIKIFFRDNALFIVNNLQRKPGPSMGNGVGFENLKNRYRLISDECPEVTMTENEYIVKLPLLEAE